MSVLTMVVTATGRAGRVPAFCRSRAMKSSSSTPTSLPVISAYPPSFPRTAMPQRSQSGSVASSRSGCTVSHSSSPFCSASRISGFGKGQVGKFPSGYSCSGTTVTSLTPILPRMRVTQTRPVPFSGV